MLCAKVTIVGIEYETELAAPLPPKFADGTREARACIRVSIPLTPPRAIGVLEYILHGDGERPGYSEG
jgi:hypothetical protein